MQRHVWERGQNDPRLMPDDVLFTRMAETFAWTNHLLQRPDFKPSMRTRDIQWRLLHDGRDDAVCEVGAARQFALLDIHSELNHRCPDLLGGQLMVYFPDGDLCDGAAEQETQGFFDVFNVPPWETWIGYFEDVPGRRGSYDSYLLAYVPSPLIELVDGGMLVNPEECILWLDKTSVGIRSRLHG